jgi:hypothetical protein
MPLSVLNAQNIAGIANITLGFSTAIVTVKVVELTFKTDHHVMKDNSSDWLNSGSVFTKPEFTFGVASKPVTHTKNTKVGVDIVLEVWPANADPTDVTVEGTATWDSAFKFTATAKIKGGRQTISFTSNNALPDAIKKITGDIEWTVNDGKTTMKADHSWGHVIYTTWDTPQDAPGDEAGITQKRMEAAVGLIAAVVSAGAGLDPHSIVHGIMQKFLNYWLDHDHMPPGYTGPTPAANLNYPSYMQDSSIPATVPGGAWNIFDFISASAECQAIVRFTRANIRQVGIPGKAQVIVVFADADTAAALEGDWEAGESGMANVTRTLGTKTCDVALFDAQPTAVGTIMDRAHVGLNNYEACLRFTFPDPGGGTPAAGTQKYYAGGTNGAVFDTKDQVITVFQALVWITWPGTPAGQPARFRIEKIVKKWH